MIRGRVRASPATPSRHQNPVAQGSAVEANIRGATAAGPQPGLLIGIDLAISATIEPARHVYRLPADPDLQGAARRHGQGGLDLPALAAQGEVMVEGISALSTVRGHGQSCAAGRHDEALLPTRVVEGYTSRLARLDTLPSLANQILPADGVVLHRGCDTASGRVAGVAGAGVAIIAGQRPRAGAGVVLAHISRRASVAVVANRHVGLAHATGDDVARIVGAEVAIVTVHAAASTTSPAGAKLIRGTGITIIAGQFIRLVDAPYPGLATVVSAGVPITAYPPRPRLALTGGAGIALCADLAIVARDLVGLEATASFREADIVGTQIAIIAGEAPGADALAQVAVVRGGANIIVVARDLIELVATADGRVTVVCGANVVIVAIEQPGRDTGTISTTLPHGAGIVIIAGTVLGQMLAPPASRAGIRGAGVQVIALQSRPGETFAPLAEVIHGTIVAVIAWGTTKGMDAPGLRIAGICGAWICIVAVDGSPRLTLSDLTVVAIGALVEVVTGNVRGRVGAPETRVATIFRTAVAIPAVGGRAGKALPRTTKVANGAGIAIVAGIVFVGRGESASTGIRIASRGQADGPETARLWTGHG